MVSYESLVSKFSIPQSKLEEECRENVWRKVSSKFTKWRNAAPHLELDEDVVEAIEGGVHDEEGKRYDLLRRWKQKFAFQGTNEKLIRCLLAAGRADLAEVAALEILGNNASTGSPLSTCTDMPAACKPFASTSVAFEEKSSCPSRDIPPSQATTISNNGQHRLLAKMPQQSSEQPDPSRLVTHSMLPERQVSTGVSDTLKTVFGLVDILHREKKEKEEVTGEKKAVVETLARKKKKIQALKGRTERLEEFLRENETKINQSKQEACQAKGELEKQQQLLSEAEEDLKSKEKKISQLQDDIYQKEMALKQEQDEKQKCEQLASAEDQLLQHQEKVSRLHQQLQQANSDLKSEKEAKEISKKQFDQVSRCITDLEKDISKARSDFDTTHSENERLKEMLKWAEDDLVEEQEEVDELKEMMRRKKEILTTYRFVMVLLFACIIGLILQNMGVLS